jgi:hypothetical protein
MWAVEHSVETSAKSETTHRVEGVGGERSRITYRMEITGPSAEPVGPEIGPEISGDFPQVLEALAARAERRA